MGQNIEIREARPEEQPEVENLVKAAYREFQPFMPEGVWERWMDNLRETIHAPEGLLLVAEHRGQIEGAVKFYPDAAQSRLGEWPPGSGAIRMLAVRPGGRGQGYGVRLTQACLGRARKAKVATVFLYTGTFMAAARHLYEKLGFRRAPEFDGDPGPIAYRLDL